MSALLKPAELLYRGINRLRRAMYRKGILKSRVLPRPVLSIGNLSIGGSGKTPLTITIARGLSESGLAVVVLTRGYRRKGSGVALVDSDDAAMFGDEPVLLRQRLGSSVPVVVGADRYQSGMWYLERYDCDVFLLDDGFQHLQLARSADIVIVDPSARMLREGSGALRDANYVMERVREGRAVTAGRLAAVMRPLSIVTGGGAMPLSHLAGRRVAAFAALADNSQFFSLLESVGAVVAERISFRDHHAYTASDLEAIRERGREAAVDLIITTEKDAVKIDAPDVFRLVVDMEVPRELIGSIVRKVMDR